MKATVFQVDRFINKRIVGVFIAVVQKVCLIKYVQLVDLLVFFTARNHLVLSLEMSIDLEWQSLTPYKSNT